MFRKADPSKRMPVWLQNGTKENLIWQLKLAVVFTVGMYAYDYIQDEIARRQRELQED